ncbi:MAG: tRNA uridine-5-carboxymethylaminomethyl(34) synthesis enzyme MnmG [Phycisphaerae bacterium]|nr:tRNA uridine-5-carboxymethylaminomethyl(34) synthesis enzyme MnmG [Phycisphaerae bacterium]
MTHMDYDVIVIGGGHAGAEAAWSASNALGPDGCVALVTMSPDRMGAMSCNPAIGGLAKGQMVREVDALGGLMGRAIDATGIMFRMLNTSRGPAVRGPRAQADRYAYACEIQRLLATRRDSIHVIAATVEEFLVEGERIAGVTLPPGAGRVHPRDDDGTGWHEHLPTPIWPSSPPESDRANDITVLRSKAVVLTTGTFMRGLMHTGEQQTPGGRVDEPAAGGMSKTLETLGFELGRLKTGTPPRLRRGTIDWDSLPAQEADASPVPFSDLPGSSLPSGAFPGLPQVSCRLTHTTADMHELIRENLHRAPMYNGEISAEHGPRYCPSIEDKVVRFADRESHHVFLEPESLHTDEIYCNGISTSLPPDVQDLLVRSMPGCEKAEIFRHGYAVEYDMVWPHQIDSTCMTKRLDGLFLAGQINGTSGYEEAAGQGLMAGLNAARLVQGKELVRLARDEAYIGVMLDDLVTKTPREPYRMFTSRAEHRLLLRSDNADARLTPLGREWGLVGDVRWDLWCTRQKAMAELDELSHRIRVDGGRTLRDCMRRPEMTAREVLNLLTSEHDVALVDRVMIDARYEGYVQRQRAEISRRGDMDRRRIRDPQAMALTSGLRAEAAEAIQRFQPSTLGQAARLAGVTPADVTLLAVALHKSR